MNDDVRSSIRSCAQTANSTIPEDFLTRQDVFLQPWKNFEKAKNLSQIPFSGIMTKLVEDYMVMSYKKQGFYNSESARITSALVDMQLTFY
jgi:soluble epoxide hydrolase / lipid-phosphate phosphatase